MGISGGVVWWKKLLRGGGFLVMNALDTFACIEGGLGFFSVDGSDTILCVAVGDE